MARLNKTKLRQESVELALINNKGAGIISDYQIKPAKVSGLDIVDLDQGQSGRLGALHYFVEMTDGRWHGPWTSRQIKTFLLGINQALVSIDRQQRGLTAKKALDSFDVRRATNMFGPLDGDLRKRLEDVINNPNPASWENACSIILNGRTYTTLWQAVIHVDPLFPKSKPAFEQWRIIPTRETLLKALAYAVQPPIVTCSMDPGRPDGPGSYHHGPHEQSSCDHPVPVEERSVNG